MINNYIFDKEYLLCLKNFKTKKDYNLIIQNLHRIIKSSEYLELLKEYKDFINNISKLFLKLNVVNPLEIAVLYNELLFDGYFSVDKQMDFINDTKYDLLVKTWGSKVCTGNSVCRHNASLLVDIERNLGNLSECVDMICVNKRNIFVQKLINSQIITLPNHLVAGLQYENSLYLYDPNNYYFLFRKNNSDSNVIRFIGVGKSLNFFDDTITNFNINLNNNNLDFSKVNVFSAKDGEYISEISDKITKVYCLYEPVINSFYMDNSKKIRKIAYLNNEIILKQKLYK